MFAIIISEKGGAERKEAFDKNEINVGRVQGNDLMLPKGNVSKHHARLLFRDGRFIVTDLNRKMWEPPRMLEWLKSAQANPRLGTPDDIAPLAVFLAGRGADYITGQIIPVDGGYTTTAVWPFEPEG